MSLVRTFTHLAGQPKAPEALHTLKRIADLVHPIMKRHGWVLPLFSEFFPDDTNLLGLNVNAGAQILVRLRPARSPGAFYPIEQLVRVMLHELTHNVHGPHDERFYSFLNKLEDEYDALVVGGWRGTGFFAPGDKLGGQGAGQRIGGASNQFDTAGKRKALEAAEARQRIEALGKGGRLGGSRVASQSGKTRQQLAAEAAERRRLDEQSCAASHPSASREAARAAADSIADVVADADLAEALALSSAMAGTAVEAYATPPSAGPLDSSSQTAGIRETNEGIIEIDLDSDSDSGDVPDNRFTEQVRQCPECTYLNPSSLAEPRCAMCGTQLPTPFSRVSGGRWNCAVCTLENDAHVQRCAACDFSKDREEKTSKKREQVEQGAEPGPPETKRSPLSSWTCELCTLVNVQASRVCSLCEAPCPLAVPQASGSKRPAGPSSGAGSIIARQKKAVLPTPLPWDCRQCGKRGIQHEFWMCGACGWIKDSSSSGIAPN